MVLGRKMEIPQGFYAQAPPVAPRGPNISSVQHNLDMRINTLSEKIKKCDEELARQKAEMKNMRVGSSSYEGAKKRAFRTLKQKRTLEAQLDRSFAQQMNVDAVSMAVAQAKEAKDTITAMEQTSKQLQKELKLVDLDKAENLQDDLEEILNETNYISETLGRDYTVDGINEAELEAELNEIEEDLFDSSLASVPANRVPSQYANQQYAPQQGAPAYQVHDPTSKHPEGY
eukprot:Plantae.Rhodophyta-Purpureofilum_apyrenoidigerum.ctg1584.p1 GENE.Plantae.Rhodophyta-Purpureofilum_apyrenoidigerum.ctg1584~~Plantae.Rhodophyta-Purpureofilum_apyrenoidigerum.ctg1584.p1  ORF type:complete len:230 (-),score=58.58 Plantae.Rhodophyta-Purpureofilum_apyrenoidigerum.ctg1584:208-897(-)